MLDPKNPPNRIALTPLHVEKTKPRSKAFNMWDLRCPGLVLRIQSSGHRAFKFVYSMGQRRVRWYHIGNIPLADARRIADRLRVAVAEGKDPHVERRPTVTQSPSGKSPTGTSKNMPGSGTGLGARSAASSRSTRSRT